MVRCQRCHVKVVILAGFPRTINQADSLAKHFQLDVVVNVDVPFATIRLRLL